MELLTDRGHAIDWPHRADEYPVLLPGTRDHWVRRLVSALDQLQDTSR